MGNQQTFIQKLVTQIIDDQKIKMKDVVTKGELASPVTLYERYAPAVRRMIRKMNAGTLGRIAAKGISGNRLSDRSAGTSLYEVHCKLWLCEYDSGRSLLREIAVTTLIAALHDHFHAPEMAQPEANGDPGLNAAQSPPYWDVGFFD